MTILAPYQQTPEGQAAIHRAVAEARLRTPTWWSDRPRARRRRTVHDVPESMTAATTSRSVRAAVRGEDLAGEIVDLATELDAEMIVIGMRRRSPVGKLFFGSTAQDVLFNASVPVLTVRAGPDRAAPAPAPYVTSVSTATADALRTSASRMHQLALPRPFPRSEGGQ